MAKIKVLKKIAALVTAIALVVCFAVSASAIGVTTTVRYVNNSTDFDVTVNVTGLEGSEYATLYAYDGEDPVHIDQQEVADNGTATFNFDANSSAANKPFKIGYDGEGAAVEGNTIGAYTVTLTNADASVVVPKDEKAVSFAYQIPAGQRVTSVTVTGTNTTAVAAPNGANTLITFTDALTADTTVELVLADAPAVDSVTVEALAASGITIKALDPSYPGYDEYYADYGYKLDNVLGGTKEEVEAANGVINNTKLTVVGKVSATAEEFGVLISENAIAGGTFTEAEFEDNFADIKYAAEEKNFQTYTFAVQLIDEATAGHTFVVPGVTYKTACYVRDVVTGNYLVVAGADATVAD